MVSMNELKQDMIIGMGYIGLDSGRLYRMRRGPKLIEAVASGTTIIINDATEGRPFRGLRVFGRTEQVRTEGAQLLDESKVEQNNFRAFKYINLSVGEGSFTLSSNIPKSPTDSSAYIMLISGNVQEISPENTTATNGVYKGQSRTFPSINGYVTIAYRNDSYANNIINFNGYWYMLNKGAEEKPYEPYTGGKPSPSPEYPQEIVSAGESGNITVEVTGRNLLTGRLYYTDYSMGIGFIKNENEVSLPYAPKSETAGIGYVIPCAPEKHYAFSVTNPNENAVVAISEYKTLEDAKNKENAIGFVAPRSASPYKSVYTSKGNGVLVCWIAGKWTDGKTSIHEHTESELLQLEYGDAATIYEPPRIPQSLTLQTPNGLPGVPVSKDGNYTDSNGQQWICDEVDLERGKYVQRVAIEKNNGGWELKPSPDISGRFFQSRLTNVFQTAVKTAVCNIANFVSWGAPTNDIYAFALNKKVIYFSPPKGAEITAEELNAKLNSLSFPVVVIGELATPIERDLTPEEIAAYKALRTYGPTTVITNDAGTGMEVTYVADRKEN